MVWECFPSLPPFEMVSATVSSSPENSNVDEEDDVATFMYTYDMLPRAGCEAE